MVLRAGLFTSYKRTGILGAVVKGALGPLLGKRFKKLVESADYTTVNQRRLPKETKSSRSNL